MLLKLGKDNIVENNSVHKTATQVYLDNPLTLFVVEEFG